MTKIDPISKPHVLLVVLVTIGLLLIPLVAMRFTSEVRWGPLDFVVMGTLIFGTGMLIDLAIRKAGRYKVVAVIGILFLFVWLWAELAVGVFTDWGS